MEFSPRMDWDHSLSLPFYYNPIGKSHRSQCGGVFFEGFLLLLLGLHGGDLLFPHRPRRRLTAYERKMMSKSQYIKYDKPNKLWIQHRKVVYLYWFKFLQHAERNKKFSVDWEKYKSWGGHEVVMNTKFDDWWKDHWKDLFSFAEGQPTNALFHTKKKPEVIAMRTALLVYEMRYKGDKWEIGCAVAKLETAKGRLLPKTLEGGVVGFYKVRDESEMDEERIKYNIWEIDNLIEGVVAQRAKRGFAKSGKEFKKPRYRKQTLDDYTTFKDGVQTPSFTEGWHSATEGAYFFYELTAAEIKEYKEIKRRVQKYISRYLNQADELMLNISQGSLDAPD